MALLKVSNVSKSYDGRKIIDNINLELNKGEIVSLLGVSGVGKTTLFQVISGLVKPDNGTVELNGRDITGVSGEVGYMLQKDLLVQYKTVLDNVALPLIIRGEKKKVAREKAGQLFPKFGLDGTQNKYPSQLSGGMRQRAAFLRTYLFSNEINLLDEPFSALDAITKGELHKWYLDIVNSINLSSIIITHDIDEAIMLSDRIYVMGGRPGSIVSTINIEKDKNQRKNYNLTEEFLEYKKEKYFIFSKMTLTSLFLAAIMSFVMRSAAQKTGHPELFLLGVLAYVTLCMTGYLGKWETELKNPYLFLIPDSPFKKIWYATLMEHVKALADGILICVPVGFVWGIRPVYVVQCILIYTVLQANKLYLKVIAQWMVGELLGKTGQELIRGLMQMVILGLGAGIAVLVGLLIDPDLVFPILLIYSLIVTTLVGLLAAIRFDSMEQMV